MCYMLVLSDSSLRSNMLELETAMIIGAVKYGLRSLIAVLPRILEKSPINMANSNFSHCSDIGSKYSNR